ncbi:hypothetical protein A6770_38975 [Nostoc minutum NIES-26]|uniref:Uncharacterized protein n=1 Tax=Nostoc minutum NIES-26 TaxID=1844469 RepID=A0A367RRA9_9NOSO|nr:hypothetical protein A6770_38975 [Nostoc minutum NIES-26]
MDQFGLSRSALVRGQTDSLVLLGYFPERVADTQKFVLSTLVRHQHSSPVPLLWVLAWILHRGKGGESFGGDRTAVYYALIKFSAFLLSVAG